MFKNGTKDAIPSDIPNYISKLSKEETKFIWTIDNVDEVHKTGTWEAINCEVTVGKNKFILSLTSKEDKLYIEPMLLQNEGSNRTIKYTLQVCVLNDKNTPINTPMMGKDKCASAKLKCGDVQKWEVLKFGEGNFNYFSSMVFNGSLKLFVEMNVFKDTHAA